MNESNPWDGWERIQSFNFYHDYGWGTFRIFACIDGSIGYAKAGGCSCNTFSDIIKTPADLTIAGSRAELRTALLRWSHADYDDFGVALSAASTITDVWQRAQEAIAEMNA